MRRSHQGLESHHHKGFSLIPNQGFVKEYSKGWEARVFRVLRCLYAEGGVLFEYI